MFYKFHPGGYIIFKNQLFKILTKHDNPLEVLNGCTILNWTGAPRWNDMGGQFKPLPTLWESRKSWVRNFEVHNHIQDLLIK